LASAAALNVIVNFSAARHAGAPENASLKALQLTAPQAASITQIPSLDQPRPGEILLQVHRVGLCGTDLTSFRGGNAMLQFPRIPGHEIAATVLEGAPGLPAGTLVTVSPYTACGQCPSCLRQRPNACQFNQTMGVQRDGALTERISMPREKLYTANLSLRDLALVEPLTVGTHAVARGRVASSDVVAVFGCGGIGLGAISGAAFRNAQVIAIDMDDRKLAIARKAGATHTVNTATQDLHATLQELTGGRGPDVCIEAIGIPDTFRAAVDEVAFTGRVVYIGYAKQQVSYETRFFVMKELDILGSRNALPEDFEEVIRMLEAGRFPVEDAISATVSLEEAPEILAQWSANPAAYTKIMVQLA
jgi:threonine dehydrogenase-like Zn-dependent dehydrogenase